MDSFTVSVIGLGYIGLPTATVLAAHDMDVVGVDVASSIVDMINGGAAHIVEPGLDDLLQKVVASGRLRAALKPQVSDVFIIAVPTPMSTDKEPDLTHVRNAAESIAPFLENGDLIILESTSPVGTTEWVSELLSGIRTDLSFPHQSGEAAEVQLAYCPERVLPGQMLEELVSNDRIIGGLTLRAGEMAKQLYSVFVKGSCLITDSRTAELCKLTENSYRDTNIAFANELSVICDKFSINVWELIGLANRHPRVDILQPGSGVGGHCIAVDPWFIVSGAQEEAQLIRTAREVNDYKPEWVVRRILEFCREDNMGGDSANSQPVRVCCLGITFKPDIDDIRESPALKIVTSLAAAGVDVAVVEPNIDKLPEELSADNIEMTQLQAGLSKADVVAVLVCHSEFVENSDIILNSPNVLDVVGLGG